MTTTNSAFGPFPVHGAYDVMVQGRVILSQFTGPWNVELVDAWGRLTGPLARALADNGPYAGIVTIHESTLCPPEALARLEQGLHYSIKYLHCKAHACVVAADVEGRDFMKARFEKMHAGTGPFVYAATLQEAMAFVLPYTVAP